MPIPRQPLRILSVEQEGAVRMALRGELDRSTLLMLARELLDCEHRHVPVVVLEMSELTFLDGMAFKLLLDTGRRMRESGRSLSIVNPSRQVRRILQVSAMVHAVDVVEELMDAPELEHGL